MSRTCSQCSNNGHNSRTCTEYTGSAEEENGIMLFGVRVTEGSSSAFRKSASMNNLSQYEQPQDSNADAGYASDDVFHSSGPSRERKRGVPWTEVEHKLFLLGLQEVGKGDWRGISRNFVKTRTPTQVASHAQKYFLRRNNQNRRRRRSSLFDITTDNVMNSPMVEDVVTHQESESLLMSRQPQLSHLATNIAGFSVSTFPMTLTPMAIPAADSSASVVSLGPMGCNQAKTPAMPICPIPLHPVPPSAKMANLTLNKKEPSVEPLPLSLKLSTSSSSGEQSSSSPTTHPSVLPAMSNGDSIISVA